MYYFVGAIIYVILNLVYSQRGNLFQNFSNFAINGQNIIDSMILAIIAVISFFIADMIFKNRKNG